MIAPDLPIEEHKESLVIGASAGALLDIMAHIRRMDQAPRSTSSNCNTSPHIGAQLYFTDYTLTGQPILPLPNGTMVGLVAGKSPS